MDRRVVVMSTLNRWVEAPRSIGRSSALPERPGVVVVRERWPDGAAAALRVPLPVGVPLGTLDGPRRRSGARRYVG